MAQGRFGRRRRYGGPAGLASLLFFLNYTRQLKLGRNAERGSSGVWAGSKFSQTHKNEPDPRKMEMNTWVKFESNSFEFNSNGFA